MRKWVWNLSTQPNTEMTRISELTPQAGDTLAITGMVWSRYGSQGHWVINMKPAFTNIK